MFEILYDHLLHLTLLSTYHVLRIALAPRDPLVDKGHQDFYINGIYKEKLKITLSFC
jgi:hypothetical protein